MKRINSAHLLILSVTTLAVMFGGCAEAGPRKHEQSWEGPHSPCGHALKQTISTGERVSLAIVPIVDTTFSAESFRESGADLDQWKQNMRSQLLGAAEAEILKRYGGHTNFQIVDRSTLEKIEDEWLLSAKSDVTDETRVKIGALTGATHLAVIHFSRFPGETRGKIIDTKIERLVDVQTGQVLASQVVTDRH